MINIQDNIAEMSAGNISIGSAYIGNQLVWEKSSPALPYDAEVEWLATDGYAYIDTEITVKQTLRFSFDIYSEHEQLGYFFGARTSASSNAITIIAKSQSGASDNGIRWYYGTKNVYVNNHMVLDTNRRVNFSTLNAARTLVYDGTYSASATSQTFSSTNNIYMFKLNNNGTPSATAVPFRCYFLKMQYGGTLVRDYIPVRKNGVGYMYDKVSGELFGNANSTGAFTYGNDVT